ncbi:MAG: hypothetical protein KGM42_09395 [Hyphomicrobiales bacterium]|nr:hypothetical protein [Hyphomicrobiales bacterium]
MIARFSAAAFCFAFLSLAGCITADKPTLSVDERQALRLTNAVVRFAPDAVIHVSAVEDEVAARSGATAADVKQAERAQIERVVASDFRSIVAPRLAGVRPVVAQITITRFYIPGALGAFVSGGSSEFSAGVDLVDAKSGEKLVSIPPGKIMGTVYRPGGVVGFAVQAAAAGDPADRKIHEMARSFATEYAGWIVGR